MSKYADNPYAYINAQDLETAVVKAMTYADALRAVRELPSMEIVRCKDCRYASESYPQCSFATWYNSEDDYCSRGKRRESE